MFFSMAASLLAALSLDAWILASILVFSASNVSSTASWISSIFSSIFSLIDSSDPLTTIWISTIFSSRWFMVLCPTLRAISTSSFTTTSSCVIAWIACFVDP
ncbi:hypothetical protein B0T14DRAFT_513252 [Immersiella caudata]|uniref:Uncharacterized protein n=1 Tax=Immersiella caudata TaxID=314043 RepID=A0AA39X5K7_9PEZI|nr:hypothetical protein B0T14DRAFT_513252 [Immersiella caudata]